MKPRLFVVAFAAAALSAGEPSEADRALLNAAAADRADAVRALVAGGADVNAASPSGWTPLMEAAKAGGMAAAEALLAAGARPDARDRAAGTALDVAQQAGQGALAELLRRHGARGSGKSVGDRVCVRPWKGAGFCGTVQAVEGTRYLIAVTRLEGCERGCAPDAECSSGREVGGPSPDAVGPSSAVWTRSWCLTHTGLE